MKYKSTTDWWDEF